MSLCAKEKPWEKYSYSRKNGQPKKGIRHKRWKSEKINEV
jgi:hypothetical protein